MEDVLKAIFVSKTKPKIRKKSHVSTWLLIYRYSKHTLKSIGVKVWLGRKDSNLRSQDQNLLPYRLATPQKKYQLLFSTTLHPILDALRRDP